MILSPNGPDTGTRQLGGVSGESLNFVLAVCAILISAASFYATYLQADSAERQVKAMTLPLIQFSHGNYNDVADTKEISFKLKNAGVGPAIIKSVDFRYQDKRYRSLDSILQACCGKALDTFREIYTHSKQTSTGTVEASEEAELDIGNWVSQPLENIILPGQSDYEFQKIAYGEGTQELWNTLNDERWKLQLDICFCSMLDECFITSKNGVVDKVETCLAKP
jgi:hypothetical protein